MANASNKYEKTVLYTVILDSIKSGEALRNPELHEQRVKRFIELEREQWDTITSQMPELLPFQTLTQAIISRSGELNLTIPLVTDLSLDVLGPPRGAIRIEKERRKVEIFAFPGPGHLPYYALNAFEEEDCYQEDAPDLEAVIRFINGWFIRELSMVDLMSELSWLKGKKVEVNWRLRIKP